MEELLKAQIARSLIALHGGARKRKAAPKRKPCIKYRKHCKKYAKGPAKSGNGMYDDSSMDDSDSMDGGAYVSKGVRHCVKYGRTCVARGKKRKPAKKRKSWLSNAKVKAYRKKNPGISMGKLAQYYHSL